MLRYPLFFFQSKGFQWSWHCLESQKSHSIWEGAVGGHSLVGSGAATWPKTGQSGSRRQAWLQGKRILSCRVRAGRDLRLVLLWPSCPHKGETCETGDNTPEDRTKVKKLSPVTPSENTSLVVPKAKPILWTGTWDNIFPGFPWIRCSQSAYHRSKHKAMWLVPVYDSSRIWPITL